MRRRHARRSWANRSDGSVRVLLECEPESSPAIIASMIERHGYEVLTCEGPGAITCEGPGATGCDLLEHGACALVDGADVVVNMLRSPAIGRRILDGVASMRRPPAIVAELPSTKLATAGATSSGSHAVDLDRIVVIESPANITNLIDSIDRAVRRPNSPIPLWGDGFC